MTLQKHKEWNQKKKFLHHWCAVVCSGRSVPTFLLYKTGNRVFWKPRYTSTRLHAVISKGRVNSPSPSINHSKCRVIGSVAMKQMVFVQRRIRTFTEPRGGGRDLEWFFQGSSQKTNSLRTSEICPFVPETDRAGRRSKRTGGSWGRKQGEGEKRTGGDCLLVGWLSLAIIEIPSPQSNYWHSDERG